MRSLWIPKWVLVVLQVFFCEWVPVPQWEGLVLVHLVSPTPGRGKLLEYIDVPEMLVGYAGGQMCKCRGIRGCLVF